MARLRDEEAPMSYLIYNALSPCFLIFSAPYFLLRSLAQRHLRKEFLQRIGCLPKISTRRPVWVHAASVGEVFCSIPLVRRIRREFPHCEIVLTTMTRTGSGTAQKHLPEADQVLLFPIDHPLTIRKWVSKINPVLLMIAETELWPNLLRRCGKRGIPIILFNGRISQKSFRNYLLLKSFFRNCLKEISLFLMQTEQDRTRIIAMGARSDRTRVLGNLKFDQSFPSVTHETMAEMAKSLGLGGKEPILIAGSTHPGEEETLLSLLKEMRKDAPPLILLLAPRHLDRLGEVEKLLEKESIPWIRKTSLTAVDRPGQEERGKGPEVILLDTMGELMKLYSLGTLVFVGGSLVPVGGHNPLEPLFFKKCVLFGPHMFNFSEIARSLIEAGGAVQVRGREDLFLHLKRLLSDEGARDEIGQKGYQFLQKHRGATEKTFEEIRPFLEKGWDARTME